MEQDINFYRDRWAILRREMAYAGLAVPRANAGWGLDRWRRFVAENEQKLQESK